MNIVGLREAKTKLSALGRKAQKGQRALVTRRGRPFFVLVGVEGEDLVDVLVRWDPSFWKELDQRRTRSARHSVPLDAIEATTKPRRRKATTPGSKRKAARRKKPPT